MMDFYHLPMHLMTAIGFYSLVMMTGASYICILAFYHDYLIRFKVMSSINLLLIVTLSQALYVTQTDHNSVIRRWFSTIFAYDVYVVIGILFVLTLTTGICYYQMKSFRESMILSNAIKETLDFLPDGLCFYQCQSGQPILTNHQMHKLCTKFMGTELLNAKHFWARLSDQQAMGCNQLISKKPLLIKMADGSVWQFARRVLSTKDSGIYELTACNVTERYQLNEQLRLNHQRLLKINHRLKSHSQNIADITREKEILSAKMCVHDDIGQSLIAFRRYVELPVTERDREKLLFLWRYNTVILQESTNERSHLSDYDLLLDSAERAGITLKISGQMPIEKTAREIFISAVRECMINTIRHAGGDVLNVKIERLKGTVSLTVGNNGKLPKDSIIERGGLKNLREMTKLAGGYMTIQSMPAFKLDILLSMNGGDKHEN